MSPMPEVRPARVDDIPCLMEIRAAVRENRLVSLVIGPDDYRPYIIDARCWVAEGQGTIQAFAALDVEAASIWALFVDPAHEGQGHGRALLAQLISEARDRGLATLALETDAGTRAETLYRRFGFTETARDGTNLHMRLAIAGGPA